MRLCVSRVGGKRAPQEAWVEIATEEKRMKAKTREDDRND